MYYNYLFRLAHTCCDVVGPWIAGEALGANSEKEKARPQQLAVATMSEWKQAASRTKWVGISSKFNEEFFFVLMVVVVFVWL